MKWKETADNYFKTHETLNDSNRDWLRKNVDLDCKKLLHQLKREQVLVVGADPQTHTFSAARLVRTLIWQTLAQVICEEVRPPGGNVRSFYYKFVDPLFTRFNLYKVLRTDPAFVAYAHVLCGSFPYTRYTATELVDQPEISKDYAQDLSEDMLRDFVLQRVFQYKGPFLFPDTDGQYKLIGTKNASMVFVIEKQGLWELCQFYHQKYGITVMASQGYPSWVSTEYLTDQLEAKKIRNLRLATLPDWDPGGFGIDEDYVDKFQSWGFKLKSHTMITNLTLFKKSVLQNNADDLTHCSDQGHQTLADKWFAKTNGINGRKAGIHVNLAETDRVDKAVDRWFEANQAKALEEDYSA